MELLVQVLALTAIGLPFVGGLAWVAWFILSLPLRRRERASLFLTLLEHGLERGESPENLVLALGRRYDPALGRSFGHLVSSITAGQSFVDALRDSPGLLPPGMVAMIRAGAEGGRLAQVLPACRRLAPDALSSVRQAYHYLVLLVCAITPAWLAITCILGVFVLPKFSQIAEDMAPEAGVAIAGLVRAFPTLVVLQTTLLVAVWLAVLVYAAGPTLRRWLDHLLPRAWDRWLLWIPWRRKRVQRDFSTLLATLLDAGLPEARSVELAAACAANQSFQLAAEEVVRELERGTPLMKALARLEGFGQLRWRIENAAHGHGGLVPALAGWEHALEAEAFHDEQATAQIVTSALVLIYGGMVAFVAISVFRFFTTLIQAAGT